MSTRVVDVEGRRLILTHLDEVLWPEDNVTKDELLAYYTAVADRLLPFIANRPLSLQRAPDAITGECAFQKTAPPGMPSWVPTRRIRTEQAALGYSEHVIGGDLPSLLYLLNLGAISVHPWSCTVDALDRPDQLLFDRALQHVVGEGDDEGAGPLVVVIANLIPYKGIAYFIDAWREVLKVTPAARAIVVGEGPARASLGCSRSTCGARAGAARF